MYFNLRSLLSTTTTLLLSATQITSNPLSYRNIPPSPLNNSQLCIPSSSPTTCSFAYYLSPKFFPTGAYYYYYLHTCSEPVNDVDDNFITFSIGDSTTVSLWTFWPFVLEATFSENGRQLNFEYAGNSYTNVGSDRCGWVMGDGVDAQWACTVVFEC